MKPKADPREVVPRIVSRLRLAGFDVTEVSAVNVRTVDESISKQTPREPALVCITSAVSMEDYHFRNLHSFQTIDISFYDLENEDLVFRAADFKYDSYLPENTELNRLFVQISDKFFPGQPNRFKIGKQ